MWWLQANKASIQCFSSRYSIYIQLGLTCFVLCVQVSSDCCTSPIFVLGCGQTRFCSAGFYSYSRNKILWHVPKFKFSTFTYLKDIGLIVVSPLGWENRCQICRFQCVIMIFVIYYFKTKAQECDIIFSLLECLKIFGCSKFNMVAALICENSFPKLA